MTRSTPLFLLLLVLSLLICGCGGDDDDPVIPNEEEVITDLIYTLIPAGGGSETVVFSFKDPDGDGGQDPQITVTGDLMANTTYSGVIQLLNASDPSDVEDITLEVAEENTEHQFFYQVGGGLDLTFNYADTDEEGNPLGILTTVATGNSSTGSLTIILRHEPDKGAAGITIGNPTPAGGETDIEVSFETSF